MKSTHFEHPFLQQIIDISKNEHKFMTILINILFEKFFIGRNNILKNQDMRYLIKLLLHSKGYYFFIIQLLKYSDLKENGGGRTPHQLKNALDLLCYVVDQMNNKDNKNESSFKESEEYEKAVEVLENIHLKLKKILLKEEEIGNSNELVTLTRGLIGFICKFVGCFNKNNGINSKSKSNEEEKFLNKTIKGIVLIFKSIIEKNAMLKSYEDKIISFEDMYV